MQGHKTIYMCVGGTLSLLVSFIFLTTHVLSQCWLFSTTLHHNSGLYACPQPGPAHSANSYPFLHSQLQCHVVKLTCPASSDSVKFFDLCSQHTLKSSLLTFITCKQEVTGKFLPLERTSEALKSNSKCQWVWEVSGPGNNPQEQFAKDPPF